MHASHYSSLLPEVFRHKTTRVRVPLPRAVLLDFHGTIAERRWEDKVIFPYVKRAVGDYLRDHWDTEQLVQRCLPGLRNESFEQRFRNKFEDAPVISEPVDGDEDLVEAREIARQMADFVVWQMESKKETRETQTIERLVWQDGLRQRRILTPLFEDVMPCVREWHTKLGCAIYVISSLERDTLRLLLENTSAGNVHQFVRDYVSTRSGDKLVSDIYKKCADSLVLAPRDDGTLAPSHHRKPRQSPESPQSELGKQDASSKSKSSSAGSSRTSSPSAAAAAKPILFLTDSGQEAKAASQANEGRAFECLLVNRPGNKRIRTYYLSQFAYIERFDDIEFVK